MQCLEILLRVAAPNSCPKNAGRGGVWEARTLRARTGHCLRCAEVGRRGEIDVEAPAEL